MEQEDNKTGDDLSNLTHDVIGAAIEVHRMLGPGLLEAVYENAMAYEFEFRNIPFERQVVFHVKYKGREAGEGRVDMLIDKRLVVELKSVDHFSAVHVSQALFYLQALDLPLALLINFKVAMARDGIKRVRRF